MAHHVAHFDNMRAIDHGNHLYPIVKKGCHAHCFQQASIHFLHVDRCDSKKPGQP